MAQNCFYRWRKDVEVETIFVHVSDAFGGSDVLDGLRTGRSEIHSIPQAPGSLGTRWLQRYNEFNEFNQLTIC